MLDPLSYVLTTLVFFSGSFIQGIIGFGFNVLGVPFVTILQGPKIAVALVSIPSQINCLFVVLRIGRNRDKAVPLNFGPVLPLLITAGIFTLGGAFLLSSLDPSVVLVMLGIFLLVFVFTDKIRKNWKPNPRHETRLALAVGATTGVLNGLAGVSGPTLAPYLYTLKLDKDQFVYYLNLLFLFMGAFQWVSFFSLGLYTWERVLTGLTFVPIAFLGIIVGEKARHRVSTVFFNRLILVVLFCTALDLLRRGLHLF